MSAARRRRVALFGATGSIGGSTLQVIAEREAEFEVTALGAGRNVGALADLAARWHPRALGIGRAELIPQLRAELAARNIRPEPEIAAGAAGLRDLAAGLDYDVLLLATVGVPGLAAAEAALARGKTLALANKEALVAAGPILLRAAAEGGGTILPVDSEHSAIHQCLRAGQSGEVERLILTASGGPFLEWTDAQLRAATPAAALRHPTWRMGRRITTDSATLMNKGFELIEACHLFALDESKVEVLIHPQSIVHSLVAYRDGSVMAQLGTADMRTPIQYALTYPAREATKREKLDLAAVARLEFRSADEGRFRALRLARQAWRAGGAAGAVLNAADEVAVEAFHAGQLSFPDISAVVEDVLGACQHLKMDQMADAQAADAAARQAAQERVTARARRRGANGSAAAR